MIRSPLSPSRQNRIYWILFLTASAWVPVLAALRMAGLL